VILNRFGAEEERGGGLTKIAKREPEFVTCATAVAQASAERKLGQSKIEQVEGFEDPGRSRVRDLPGCPVVRLVADLRADLQCVVGMQAARICPDGPRDHAEAVCVDAGVAGADVDHTVSHCR
jgi:hypothetical protein